MRHLGGPYLFCRLQESQFTADLRSRSKLMTKLPTDFLMLLAYQEGESNTYYARLFSIDLKVGDMQSQIMPLPYGVLLPKMYEYF